MDYEQFIKLNTINHSDALAFAKSLPDNSVNCVVTSPPYWGLRNYDCEGQYGLEPTLKEFIETLVILFREIRRVLRPDGVAWVNMGDSYASSVNGRSAADTKALSDDDRTFRDKPFSTVGNGLKPKDLCGQPWRLAFALQDDGWYLRQDIIWAKTNPMPESVQDRCTKSHEYVFLLTKSERYWFDSESIREDCVDGDTRYPNGSKGSKSDNKGLRMTGGDFSKRYADEQLNHGGESHRQPYSQRNKRSVWTVSTEPTKEAHFATFPRKLIEPMILAGCPERVCSKCGAPWVREVEKEFESGQIGTRNSGPKGLDDSSRWGDYPRGYTSTSDLGLYPLCDCNSETRPGICYDPFMGSGTTALVARSLGRDYIGSELSPDYIAIAEERLRMPFDEHKIVKANKPIPKLRVQIDGITLEQQVLFDE